MGFQIASSNAGISNNSAGTIDIRNSKIHDNDSSGIVLGGSATLLISDSEIYSNTALRGGGVSFNAGSGHTFTNTTFSNNSATASGGAIFVQNISGALTLANVTLKNNSTTGYGGAISSNGRPVNVSKCTISGNQAGAGGGAVYSTAAMSFENCVITGNTAGSYGGAFSMNNAGLTLKNSTVANNSSVTHGGAIFGNNVGASTIATDTIFWGNVSASNTGHLAYHNGGTFTLTNAIMQNDGDTDLTDEPVVFPARTPSSLNGYLSDNDPNFVNETWW